MHEYLSILNVIKKKKTYYIIQLSPVSKRLLNRRRI